MTDDINETLISGEEYLAKRPDFKFAGRNAELRDIQEILLQKKNNCIVLTGMSGVGMTGLVMGLQTSKANPETPPKLLNMPLYFLDVDKLFETGDPAKISKVFLDVRTKLASVPGSVLYIESMGNFIDCCTKTGCTHLMNGLLGDIKKGKYQSILETVYDDLAKVIKYNSEIDAAYTLRVLKEPKGEELKVIVETAVPALEKHHGIKIAPEAVALAINLATKHRTGTLQAMPAGVLSLLDRSLSSYALKAHSEPFQLINLNIKLKDITLALSGAAPEPLKDVSKGDLQKLWKTTESEIAQFKTVWDQRKKELELTHSRQQVAQQRLTKLENRLAKLLKESEGDGQTIGESPEIVKTQEDIITTQNQVREGLAKFNEITAAVNKELLLGEPHVLDAFSNITGIPVKKLTQSDREKILGLEDRMNYRVINQKHAIRNLVSSVKNAAAGLSEDGKPKGAFLYLGPSGVGKTETVRSFNDEMFDDPNAMIRIDMSEYMEKNAANKLIGSPPGYVGFEEGGVLTEAMQKRPIRVILIDEIEKAHPDILNLFLQVLDDGRLTDGKGVTVSFDNTYLFFTSNIGQYNFPNRTIDYAEAMDKSIVELKEAGLKNELLNRFSGKRNIIGYYPLEPEDIEQIADRELKKVNTKLKKIGLEIQISPEDIKKIGQALYNPANGARPVPGFFNDHVRAKASDIILSSPGTKGVLKMKFDDAAHTMELVEILPAEPAPTAAPATTLRAEMRQASTLQPPSNG